jgi:hypothetical protein
MAVFDLSAFRTAYPVFDSVPDATVEAAATSALCLIGQDGCDCDVQMWQLMVAHLLYIQGQVATGNGNAGAVTSATIDKVSVSFAAPPFGTSAYKFWLFKSPYGGQLLALLDRCSKGGVYVGGLPERSAFRSVGGVFPGRGRWLR